MRIILLATLLASATALHAAGDAAKGSEIYNTKSKCYMCHAKDGSGSTPAGKSMGAHDLRSADVQKQTDEALLKVLADGKNKMPSFKSSLNEEQRRDVLAYIRTLKP